MKKSDIDNIRFLNRIEPFCRGRKVCSSMSTIRKITGLSSQRVYRYMYINDLVIEDSQKYTRKKVNNKTQERVAYIRNRIEEKPDITLQELGEELNCSKQSVSQLIHRYHIKKTKTDKMEIFYE